MSVEEVATPEIDKMRAVHERSQAIGEFLDWLSNQGVRRMRYDRVDIGDGEMRERWMPDGRSIQALLAEFFRIDLAKVEQEKRAILDAFRAANA